MLFSTLSALGLMAVASAAPAVHSRFESEYAEREAIQAPAEHGLTWTPRSIEARAFGNSATNFGTSLDAAQLLAEEEIIILTLQQQQLEAAVLQQEIELQRAIEAQLRANLQLQFALDSIRINTFNNINQNINTVVIIVTEVIDNRNKNNKNSRFIYRQLQANAQATQIVFIQIVEQSVINIENAIPSPTIQNTTAQPSASAQALPQLGTYIANSTIALQQQGVNLLPNGQGIPQFSNVQAFTDPALIVQRDQRAVVQFVGNGNEFVTRGQASVVVVNGS